MRYDELTGAVQSERWRYDGKLHRVGKPACQNYDSAGNVVGESWFIDGLEHRPDGERAGFGFDPETGTYIFEAWYERGKLHRLDDLPAEIERWGTTGHLAAVVWYQEGQRHRGHDRPAVETYTEDGKIDERKWFRSGKLHRDKGPAIVKYDAEGNVVSKQYYICGASVFPICPKAPILG